MELSTVLAWLYFDAPPHRPYELQRAHQVYRCLRECDFDGSCLVSNWAAALSAKGFTAEAVRLLGAPPADLRKGTPDGVFTLGDEGYPAFLRSRLGLAAPVLLWTLESARASASAFEARSTLEHALQGEGALCRAGSGTSANAVCIGGVGCRQPSEFRAVIAEMVGRWAADRGSAAVSGGAQGCDSLFGNSTFDAGGVAYHFLPYGINQAQRMAYDESDRRGTLISNWAVDAPFTGYQAMARNSMVYGCADLTLILSARSGVGGTWGGAVSALRAKRRLAVVLTSCLESKNATDQDRDCNQAMHQLANLGAYVLDLRDLAPGVLPNFADIGSRLDACLEAAQSGYAPGSLFAWSA